MKTILFTLLLCLTGTVAFSQEDVTTNQVEDTTLYRIIKTDGTELIGYILKQDEREMLVQTKDGRKIIIPQYVVKEIVVVNSK